MKILSVIYSNFDHELNEAAVSWLKNFPGEELSHCAWNFHSKIKFEDGLFKATVKKYGVVVSRIENTDIKQLIRETNDEFGYD